MTDAELQKDATAYIYEVTTLLGTLNALMDLRAQGPLIGECPVALLEANLIHARVLTSFFLPTKAARDTDITAKGFIGSHFDADGPAVHRLQVARRQLDKHLAHLTQDRREKTTGYRVAEIAGDLLVLHRQFITQLESEQPERIAWFSFLKPFVEEFEKRYGTQ